MPLTFGGKLVDGTRAATVKPLAEREQLTSAAREQPAPAAPARNAIARYTDRQADLAEIANDARVADVPAGAVEVLTFLRLLAMVFEARRHLRQMVAERREIDVDALNDPALADHPRRPAMLHEYEDRVQAESLATIALAEHQAHLAAAWDRIAAQDKHRYGLYTLVGEPDPDQHIDITLWRDDKPVNWLAPLPDDWSIPAGIAHLAYDPERSRYGVHTYTFEEIFHSDAAGF